MPGDKDLLINDKIMCAYIKTSISGRHRCRCADDMCTDYLYKDQGDVQYADCLEW